MEDELSLLVVDLLSDVTKGLKPGQVDIIMKNKNEFSTRFKELFEYCSQDLRLASLKTYLEDMVKLWNWTEKQQKKFGSKIKVVESIEKIFANKRDCLAVNSAKFGEVTILERESFDFNMVDNYKILTEKDLFPTTDFIGKSIFEATRMFIEKVETLNRQTGERFIIPGFELQKYLFKNQNNFRQKLEVGCWYYYVATSFRNCGGHLDIPCSCWDGSFQHRFSSWVFRTWDSCDHFFVLKIIRKI